MNKSPILVQFSGMFVHEMSSVLDSLIVVRA
jgi:hypothetical protein